MWSKKKARADIVRTYFCLLRESGAESFALGDSVVIRSVVADDAVAGEDRRRQPCRSPPSFSSTRRLPSRKSRRARFSCHPASASQAENIGSNSSSSRTSAPIAGQPKAISCRSCRSSTRRMSADVMRVTSAPFFFAPSATAFCHRFGVSCSAPVYNCCFHNWYSLS